jgi:hypothetical protein
MKLALAAALIAFAASAPAQSANKERSARFIAALCPPYLADLNKHPAIAFAVQHRALSTEALCSCVEQEFISDPKVREFLNVSDSQVALKRLSSPEFKAYGSMLAMRSAFVCLVPELETTMKETPLE